MAKNVYPEEKGSVMINGYKFDYAMKRSKGESCFGIHSSRIFSLKLDKDGKRVADYERAYTLRPDKEDDETACCINYLVDRYGRIKKKEKKE